MTTNMDFLACPLPEDVQRLKNFGDFDRARSVIKLRLENPKVPEMLKERLKYELLILEELPHAYPYTKAQVLQRLQRRIAGFTKEEMESLRDDGTLDWIYVNGKVRFKDDCCESLIKTRIDYNPRIIDKKALGQKYENFHRLDEIIAKMKKDGHVHARYRLRTAISIQPEAQRPGERIRVHMALPLKDAQCMPGKKIITQPEAKYIAPEDTAQRTAYFEEIYQPGMKFVSEYEFDIDTVYVDPKPEEVSMDQPRFDTEEMLPQIQFTPFIRDLASRLTGEETNPLVIARRFYDYVSTNTCYRYVRPYYTVTNIPEYFGTDLRGDCGMHALLFITLCRCAGIPAQWQAGLYARPGSLGNHDWARFYIAPYGWLYADGSFGGGAYREGHYDRWNFYFGNLEPWRMVSNRDFQQTFDPPSKHPRFDPYDNQSGEVEYEDRRLSHREFKCERELLSYEIVD